MDEGDAMLREIDERIERVRALLKDRPTDAPKYETQLSFLDVRRTELLAALRAHRALS
jgi:hypothetical protein